MKPGQDSSLSPGLEQRQRPVGDSGCSPRGKTPRAEAIWSKMPQQYLSHLARIWLLLSQFPSEIPARNDNDIIKACGRELVRQRIWICGSVSWGEKALQQVREPRQAPESPTGERPAPHRSVLPIIGCRRTADI